MPNTVKENAVNSSRHPKKLLTVKSALKAGQYDNTCACSPDDYMLGYTAALSNTNDYISEQLAHAYSH